MKILSRSVLQTVTVCILALFAAAPAIAQNSVQFSKTLYPAGSQPWWVASGDFNGDGVLDLVVANQLSGNISVYIGNGHGGFKPQVNYTTAGDPTAIAVGDFNEDGKLDLAVVNLFNNAAGLSILLGNGDGTFAPAVNYPTSDGPDAIVAGDFNRDGHVDLAVTNANSQTVSIFLGFGNGTFKSRVDYDSGPQPAHLASADLNGDGILDLVVANHGTNSVSVLLGNDDGTFAGRVPYVTASVATSVAVADFNGDLKPDLVVTDQQSAQVSILLGNGDGTFQTKVDYSVGTLPLSVVVGDFNNDGKIDLAVANQPSTTASSNTISLLLGNGDGTFQPKTDYDGGTDPSYMVAGDFNGDGTLDLATGDCCGTQGLAVLLTRVLDTDSQFSQLNGGNAFTGNQTVNGAVTATTFVGNGAGLTRVAADTANTANFATTANFANTANVATSAATATNALSLGNVLAANYARLDIGNNLTGNQVVTGNLSASGSLSATGSATLLGPVKIGGGTPIIEHLSQNSTITVPVIAPNNCATLSLVTLSGASDGDTIALGVKNALTSGGNLTYFAWVSATNTVTIKVCNPHGTTNSALTGMIRVDIWKH